MVAAAEDAGPELPAAMLAAVSAENPKFCTAAESVFVPAAACVFAVAPAVAEALVSTAARATPRSLAADVASVCVAPPGMALASWLWVCASLGGGFCEAMVFGFGAFALALVALGVWLPPAAGAGAAVEACGAGASASSAAELASCAEARDALFVGLLRPPLTPPIAGDESEAPFVEDDTTGAATAMTAATGWVAALAAFAVAAFA